MSKYYFVSFYPKEDGTGGAFREAIRVETKLDHTDHRSLNKILRASHKKGQELKAQSFRIFELAMPRAWIVEYEDICDLCGEKGIGKGLRFCDECSRVI